MLLGKTVVITGISSGIGARTAELAVAQGADVIGIDMKEPAAPSSNFIKGDLSSPAGIAAVVQQLPGRFDALLNIAGISGKIGAAPTLPGINDRFSSPPSPCRSVHSTKRCQFSPAAARI